MKHRSLLYTGLLGALLSANQVYAGDVGSASVASYSTANTVTRAVTPDPTALSKSFHTPAFNVIDPLDEFSGRDWNGFTPLDNTVTHEMREARERAAAKASAAFEETARAGLYQIRTAHTDQPGIAKRRRQQRRDPNHVGERRPSDDRAVAAKERREPEGTRHEECAECFLRAAVPWQETEREIEQVAGARIEE